MKQAEVGIIGGTGLSDVLTQQGGEAVECSTPFGPPSAPLILTEWQGVRVAFLLRHGRGHVLNPSHVPYRANIWALKELGVTSIIASGATGSLREDIQPGQLVICDQVIDKTFRREGTFFDEGVVAHVELAEPFCPNLRDALVKAAGRVDATVHPAGTYVCMEGPQFSTRAESHMHRQWGGDLIGMTCMPEAKLAREAEICYALVSLPTDYDCWRPPPPKGDHPGVLDEVIKNLKAASAKASKLIEEALPHLAEASTDCRCRSALKQAIWSDPERIPSAVRVKLKPLISRYLADV